MESIKVKAALQLFREQWHRVDPLSHGTITSEQLVELLEQLPQVC